MKTLFTLILLTFGINQIYCQDSAQMKKAPWFVQRFRVSAGLFIPVNNTNIEIDPSDGNGTDIDFEDDLGFEEVTPTLLTDFQWRTSRRSRLDFSFYLVKRKSTKTLDKDIIFGEDTFKINSNVSSFFNTDIYHISYGYALLSKPKFEAGLLVGVHVVGAKAGINFKGNNLDIAASSDYKITAPLPDFGVWGGYEITKRFAVNAEAGYLGLTVNGIKGRILAYSVIVSYRIIDPLHVSVGFTGLNFDINAERKYLDGDLRWSNNGATITVTYDFGKKNWLTN